LFALVAASFKFCLIWWQIPPGHCVFVILYISMIGGVLVVALRGGLWGCLGEV